MVAKAWTCSSPSGHCTPGTTLGSAVLDGAPKTQSRLDDRLQRLVYHARWAAGGSLDRARSFQPLPLGNSVAAPLSRVCTGVFAPFVHPVWATRSHSRRSWPTFCRRRRVGSVATVGLVASSGNPSRIHGQSSTSGQRGSRANASGLQGGGCLPSSSNPQRSAATKHTFYPLLQSPTATRS